jgi:hypothetical protein
MAVDLFAPNGYHYLDRDKFRWIVAIFMADGASVTIRRANANDLKTYYPIKFKGNGEPVPLFINYLFLEWREDITLQICRATTKFIKVLSAHDEEGILRPILIRRNAVEENRAMVIAKGFNERTITRSFYGKGSLVRVIEGNFIDKRVRLEQDILLEMCGRTKVRVNIGGINATIELFKLAL